MSHVCDSNILIYYLNSFLDTTAREVVDAAIEGGAVISVITRIETLGWQGHDTPSFQEAEDLIQLFEIEPLTNSIVNETIRIRQQHNLKLPDAIIAATAIHLDLPLMTRNVSDFAKITSLRCVNPFES
ncbi:MAG: type II toxin-antitoxin system VapC family toxin [Planctomycetota bacterium]|nr:type II toxin-antitoxin system VapC family toxin [Planctomycetota bacterium]MDA1138955.1 type II toxin-antitoxin system VapC family toxin [Planctomycetota bacterium]